MKHGLNRSSAMLLLLMAPALLSACVSQSKYDELMAQNQQLQTENQQLHTQNQQLQQHVATAQAHVHRLQEAVKYTINSDLLFPSGGWEISAAGKEIIAKMAKKLAPEQQDKIIVNGYTDDHPIGPGLMQQGITSNQMLSQKRAETVMQYMISQGVNPDLVAAQGFGEADPVAPNSTPQGRAQNRRVELTLAVAGAGS
jgi:chemotaxis protein MotB